MRIYFLSARTAGLKLNGVYLGVIDNFERFIDADPDERILAEVVPDGNAQPVNFFLDRDFFKNPPDFADVYLTGGDAVVRISKFTEKDGAVRVIAQKRMGGLLATLISNGGVPCLIAEGKTTEHYDLSPGFARAALTESEIGGRPVLLVEGDRCLTVLSEEGKRVFYNAAESWKTGDRLEITVDFHTCAGCRAVCLFDYDGQTMTLSESRTQEQFPPDEAVLHFAFFESVLTRADYAKYLSDELRPRADELPAFLGEFVDVSVPPEKFLNEHPDVRAVGLTYPLAHNRFEIRYYAVDLKDGLIANIYEVE